MPFCQARVVLRWWLATYAAVLLTAGPVDAESPAAVTPTARAGADWPDFLGPGRRSKSPETGLLDAWPEQGPPIAWQAEMGAGYTAPAVSGGRLVHYGRFGNAARLTCRDAATGQELWRTEHPTGYRDMLGYNNGPRSSPVIDGGVIDDGRVYTISPEGLLRCVTLATGELVWEVDTAERYSVVKNFFGVGSTPLVWGGLVIANIGGSPPGGPSDVYAARGRVQGAGTGVVAFDKATGEERWRATDELASYASPTVVELGGRAWCFVFARGGLVALDPATGAVDFEFPWRSVKLESVNAATPIVIDQAVFISETYENGAAMVRFAGGGPELVWTDQQRRRNQSLALHWNTPVYHDGTLYGSSGRHAGGAELRAVDAATGAVRWTQPGLGRASLLYADGKLICLSEDGVLRLLDATPDAYRLISQHKPVDGRGRRLLRGDAWVAPVLSRGLLYVRGKDRLVCLDLADGTGR
ncbi:MAG: PQQ-binding-like beta-propeller repeat protein [Planctomycetota bacterium]